MPGSLASTSQMLGLLESNCHAGLLRMSAPDLMPSGITDSCYYLQPPLCLEQIQPQAMTEVRVWQIHSSPCDSTWGSTRDTTVTILLFLSDQGFPVSSCRAMDPFEIVMRAPAPLTKETFRYTFCL